MRFYCHYSLKNSEGRITNSGVSLQLLTKSGEGVGRASGGDSAGVEQVTQTSTTAFILKAKSVLNIFTATGRCP